MFVHGSKRRACALWAVACAMALVLAAPAAAHADEGVGATAGKGAVAPVDQGALSAEVSWSLDAEGSLRIYPTDGQAGSFELTGKVPWAPEALKSAVVEPGVSAFGRLSELFYGCASLEHVDLSGLDTSKVKHMDNLVARSPKLTTVNFGSFDTSNVETMSNMFINCKSLTSLDLSSFDTSNVKRMEGLFKECDSLVSVKVGPGFSLRGAAADPANWAQLPASFDPAPDRGDGVARVLAGTWYVEELMAADPDAAVLYGAADAPATLAEAGWDASRGPATWRAVEVVAVPEGAQSGVLPGGDGGVGWYSEPDGMLCVYPVNGLRGSFSLDPIPSWADCNPVKGFVESGVTVAPGGSVRGMFYNCASLASLDLAGLDVSGAENMSNLFAGCTSLASLDLSRFDTSNVVDMGAMFAGCTSLEALDLSCLDTSSAEVMGYMFASCSSLADLDVTGLDTSKIEDMSGMFYNCSNLEALDLGSFDTSKVMRMAFMFEGCERLASVKLLDAFSMDGVDDLSKMFYGCPALAEIPERVSIPEGAQADSAFGLVPADDGVIFAVEAGALASEPLATIYRGSDAGVIQYPWAAGGRVLDISQIMGGLSEAILRDGAELAAGAQVAVGDSLKAAVRPEAASHLHLDDVSAQWQRRAAGEEAFSDIEGAEGWAYAPSEADRGCELRVAALGSGNCTGSVASQPVKVAAASLEPVNPAPVNPEPADPAKPLSKTGDGAGAVAAAFALCGLAALAVGAGARRARRS